VGSERCVARGAVAARETRRRGRRRGGRAGAWLAAALWIVPALCAARGASAHGSHATVIRGAVTYQRLCASCHGAKARGNGPRAADGLARPTDLTRIRARHGAFDRRAVAAWIDGDARAPAHGSAERPVWGTHELRAEPDAARAGDAVAPRLRELLDYLEHAQAPR